MYTLLKNSETVTINESEANYSIFEKDHRSNIPIINNGENTTLYKALKGLAHNTCI